jgi:hypothetical protein
MNKLYGHITDEVMAGNCDVRVEKKQDETEAHQKRLKAQIIDSHDSCNIQKVLDRLELKCVNCHQNPPSPPVELCVLRIAPGSLGRFWAVDPTRSFLSENIRLCGDRVVSFSHFDMS